MYIFDPVKVYQDGLPHDFLEDTVRLLYDCYTQAYQETKKFPKAERHDVRSHYRRALIEWQWREIATKYKEDGLNAAPIPNSIESAFHTEIRADGIVLVQAYIETRTATVRPAVHRETLTMESRPLFDEMEPVRDAGLFAILVHGPADPRAPGFANIIFPLRDSRRYHDARIDLLASFPEVVASKTSFQEELIADEIEPELRKDIPEVGG
jgi:hypothetical protein